MSKIKCYNCQVFGHFAKNCPGQRKRFKGKQHASTADTDDEPQEKKTKGSNLDQVANGIRKKYYLISALSGSITCSSETWLMDSGASRHMTSY